MCPRADLCSWGYSVLQSVLFAFCVVWVVTHV
jgi:hypothetical protein